MALTREQIRKRKAIMRDAGISYSDINNDSWGPWQERTYNDFIKSLKKDVKPRVTYGYAAPIGNPAGTIAKIASAVVAAAPILADPQGAANAVRGAVSSIGSGISTAKQYVSDVFNWGNSGPRTIESANSFVPLSSSRVMTDAAPADSTTTTPAANPTDTTATRPTPSPEPEPEPPNNNKKPNLLRRAWKWTKAHPKTAVAAGATAFYPTREYIVKPIANYGLPAIGNAGAYITTGQAPFNIPAVTNDSTELWYKGSVGKVGTPTVETQSQQTKNQTTAASDTVVGKPRFDKAPVTTSTQAQLDSLNRAWFNQ